MRTDINFTFKNYKTLKTQNNFNNDFLIIANNNITIKSKSNEKKNLNVQKITNKSFISVAQKSLFKNFRKSIYGPLFFFYCTNLFSSAKTTILKKKNLSTINILLFKVNNKIYLSKKLLVANFLTYQENIVLLFQLNNVGLKIIFK